MAVSRVTFGNRPGDLFGHGPVFKKDQGGDGPDPILPRCLGIFIHIQFADFDLPFKFNGQFLDHRGNGPAGTAPGSPKINQGRNRESNISLLKFSSVTSVIFFSAMSSPFFILWLNLNTVRKVIRILIPFPSIVNTYPNRQGKILTLEVFLV